MSHTLAYGDIIRIYCSMEDNGDDKSKIRGFLMSKGFADTNIYFLKSENFTQFELRNSLFEILPYSSFEIHDEAKDKKEEDKKKIQNTKNSKKTELQQFKSKINKERTREISFDSQVVIRHVNSDAYLQGQFSCPETGIGSFKVILSDELSSDVKFKITRFRNSDKESQKIQSKDQFILYHCTSHCYLNIGDLKQKVFLDKQIQCQGQSICNPFELAKKDNEAYKFVSQRPLIKQPHEGNNKFINRHEVVNMSKPTLVLKFLLEKSSNQQYTQSDIQHNDVIYIRNTQNMSYLTADLWSGDVRLVSYFGDKAGDFPYEGIWEVSIPRENEKGQFDNTKSYSLKHYITDRICKVEKASVKAKSNSNPDDLDQEEVQIQNLPLKKLQLYSMIPSSKNGGKPQPIDTFRIVNYNQSKTLKHRDLVFLQVCKSHQDSNNSQHTSTKILSDQNKNAEYLDIGNRTQKNYRTKLETQCLKNTQNYSLQLTRGPLTNAFQIFKLEDKKLKQINTLLSSVEILTNFCDVLIVLDYLFKKDQSKNPHSNKQSYQDMSQIPYHRALSQSVHQNYIQQSNYQARSKLSISIIQPKTEDQSQSALQKFLNQYLNYYVLNLVITTIEYLYKNITKKNKKLDFAFMMMIKSLGLIEILIEAIFFIQRNNYEIAKVSSKFKNKKYRKDRLDECFKQIYLLLTKLSAQNSCKLHLGKWFDMFMSQFYHLKKDFIHSLIIILLNEKFIIKTLKKKDILDCIQKMRQNIGDQKALSQYLELLSSFCRVKNSAIPSNQREIITQMKKNKDIFYSFVRNPDISLQNLNWKKQLCYTMLQQKQFDFVYNKKNQKQKYIIFLLNLYAELIYDQPSNEIQDVEKFIKLDTVKIFFIKKDDLEEKSAFQKEVIGPFLKLAHHFFQSRLNNKKTRVKMINKEETLYKSWQKRNKSEKFQISNTQSNAKNEEIFNEYIDIIKFVKEQILQKQLKQKNYQVQTLKTIETSLDFMRTVFKIKEVEIMDEIFKLIISVVIKLKVQLIFGNAWGSIKKLHNYQENQNQAQIDNKSRDNPTREELIDSIDKIISGNTQKLLSQKKMQRLLIDTRNLAGQILDMKINLLLNKGLNKMNEFFLKVCDNDMNIQKFNKPRNGDSLVFAQNNYWIWINKITTIVDQQINQQLNLLLSNQIEGKKTLVKLLIECIFVDSLKIVNKIVLLIFKLYELRKTLMYRFKDSFIIINDHFMDISNFNAIWISDFEKIKPYDQQRKHTLIKRIQILSYILRHYEEENKMKFVKKIYDLIITSDKKNKEDKEDKEDKFDQEMMNKQNIKEFQKGLSDYIVINQTQTNLTINQIQLQKMIGNQKIHTYVLGYIETLSQQNKYYDEHLNIVYEFLTLLVYNNTKNKKILAKYIKVALKHITNNYKAIQFIKKLTIQNQNIINDRDLVSTIVKSILEAAHSVHGDQDKIIIKAKLIESLRVFCILEGKAHLENQTLIMIKLQNKEYQNTLMFSTIEYKTNKNIRRQKKEGLVNILEELLKIGQDNQRLRNYDQNSSSDFEEQCRQLDQKSIKDFKKYPELYQSFIKFRENYNQILQRQQNQEFQNNDNEQNLEIEVPGNILCLAAYFSTMSALVEGDHQVNKGKCCNMHPYESLNELIRDAAKCWPLIRHVRAYIIKLYLIDLTKVSSEQKHGTGGGTVRSNHPTITSNNTNSTSKQNQVKQYEPLLSILFDKEIDVLIERISSTNSDFLPNYSRISLLKITTPIRYQYMGSYFYCSVQQILYEINFIFKRLEEYQYENQDLKRKKNQNKGEQGKLKQLIIALGQMYQMISKINYPNTIQQLLDSILLKSFTVVKLINITEHNEFDFLTNNNEQANKISNIIDSLPKLNNMIMTKKTNASQTNTKFVVHVFFLSKEESRQNLVSNSNSYQLFNLNKLTRTSTNIKKSYIRKLIPIPAEPETNKDQNQKDENTLSLQYDKKMKKADLLYEQLQRCDKQIRTNKLLQIISEDLVERKQANQIIEEEMDYLVKLCCELDNTTKMPNAQEIQYRVVGYKKFMESIIHLVTKSPAHLTLQGKIKTIKLIRLIFEQRVSIQCKLSNNKNKQWESGMFQDTKLKQLQKIQIQFKDLKLNQMIVAILKSEVQSYQLLSQTYKLGVKFLYNGNSECQQAILKNLQEDPQNMVMVELFNFIKKMRLQISQEKFVIQSKQSKNLVQDNFPALMIDTFHHYDPKNKIMCKLGVEKDNSKQFEQQIILKIQCICEAYQFLQLMCENDNQTCKNFLREQTNENGNPKYNSINFVSQTTKLFKVVLEKFNSESNHYNILQYLADFFIEVTQLPCIKNQHELCSTSIFADIREKVINSDKQNNKSNTSNPKEGAPLKTSNPDSPGPQKPMCYLMDFAVNAGLSLLQGGSKQIYDSLISTMDELFIYQIFKYQTQVLQILNKKHPQCPQIQQFNSDTLKVLLTTDPEHAKIRKRIHMVFNLFALIEKISRYMIQQSQESSVHKDSLFDKFHKHVDNIEKEKLQKKQNNNEPIKCYAPIIQKFPQQLKHIEVVFDSTKQYLYFPNLPIFNQLSKETQLQVVENIKRDTQIDKITDFLVKSSQINHIMDWNFKVEDRLSLKIETLDLIRLNILILTTIIVSLYILFTSIVFVQIQGKMKMLKSIDNPIINGLVNILCVFHLFFSVYFVFTWCTLKYRMPIQRQLKEKGDEEVKKLLRKIDEDKSFDHKDLLKCIQLMFKNQSEIYSILFFFILFSFMGYFVGLEWYSMLIFDIVTRQKILKNVIQAITSNLKQLFVVSLLILAFVYVFNIISIEYNLYLPLIYENEDQKCTVLMDCLISLYTSGQIGQKHKEFKFTKFIADLLYIVIMELLFSNIVSGIVIDTFAKLRDQRKTIQSDNKTKCFICGISKGTLEKQLREEQDSNLKHQTQLKKFEDHTTNVHNQWDYIYYLYILSKKDITTYTGIEYFIKKQCTDDQYDWIPIYEQDDDKDIKQILDTTQKLIPIIKDRLKIKKQLQIGSS